MAEQASPATITVATASKIFCILGHHLRPLASFEYTSSLQDPSTYSSCGVILSSFCPLEGQHRHAGCRCQSLLRMETQHVAASAAAAGHCRSRHIQCAVVHPLGLYGTRWCLAFNQHRHYVVGLQTASGTIS